MQMMKFVKEYWIAFLVMILVLGLFFVPYFYFHLEQLSSKDPRSIDEYTLLYYVFASFAALIAAIIAYTQLKKINKSLNADYLIRIDERWRSSEIIKARAIIHHLYLDVSSILAEQGISEEYAIQERIGNEIKKMSTEKDKVKKFICVLNFLDFMETVGYLFTQGYLPKESLNELFGASIGFNYNIFKPYIICRREKHKIQGFYKEFQSLYEAIQCNKCNEKHD